MHHLHRRVASHQPLKSHLLLAVGLSAILTGLFPAPVLAATVTFTGADTTDPNSLLRAANYSTGTLPASGDTILFNGTAGVNSTLTFNYPGGIAAYGSPSGVTYSVAAGQSGSLNIRGTGLTLYLLSTSALTVAAGAGPVTFDVSDSNGPLQFGLNGATNATHVFANNSANPVTLNNVVLLSGNGQQTNGLQTAQFTGSGNFVLNVSLDQFGVALSHAGTGLVTMSRANNIYATGTTIGVAQSASVLRATATQTLGTGNVTIGQGAASASRLELTGGISLSIPVSLPARTNTSVGIQNLSGNNTLSGNLNLADGGTTVTLQSDAGNLTLSGTIANPFSGASGKTLVLQGAGNGTISGQIGGTLTGSLAVNKAGSGTWTLSRANNTQIATTVSGGVLEISANGALSNGNVSVLSTATCLTIDTGVTAPMSVSRGILTLAGGGTPALTDVGYIDLTSGANITVYELMLGTTFAPAGVYSAAQLPDYIRGLGTITVVTVPEPGTWVLLCAGFTGLVGGLVRRRRRAMV